MKPGGSEFEHDSDDLFFLSESESNKRTRDLMDDVKL